MARRGSAARGLKTGQKKVGKNTCTHTHCVYHPTMINTKHTHRGTCQACGAVQAVMANGELAKHGYTVDWGYFHGVCFGSANKPLEHDKAVTEKIVNELREIVAPRADKLAADLESGAVEPKWFKRVKLQRAFGQQQKYEDTACKREELSDDVAQQQTRSAIFKAQTEARNARTHADMLEKLIASRFGQELYPVQREERKELKAGVKVRVGGKSGWIGEVVEIKDKVASGCGPYMNGRMMPHAFIRTPKGGVIAIPTRTIRQEAIGVE